MPSFGELSERVLERQERVRALFRGETPEPPVAYMCPAGYTQTTAGQVFDEARALRDVRYVADFQETGIKGVLEEDNDNTPFAWAWAGGVHFIDSLFGIRPAVHGDRVWGEPPEWDLDGGELPRFDVRGGLVPRALEEIEALRSRFGDVPITPPDPSGPLNGALNVFGSQRFLRFAGRGPASAMLAVEHVARAIVEVLRELDRVIGPNAVHIAPPHSWLPGEYVLMPQCSSQTVSRETYEKVVRRADEMVLREFDGGVFHICGKSTHLIPTLREMRRVKGVELVGSPGSYDPTLDYPAYFHGLRDDQIVMVMVGRNSKSEELDLTMRERTGRISADEVMEVSGGERTILRFTNVQVLRRFRKMYP